MIIIFWLFSYKSLLSFSLGANLVVELDKWLSLVLGSLLYEGALFSEMEKVSSVELYPVRPWNRQNYKEKRQMREWRFPCGSDSLHRIKDVFECLLGRAWEYALHCCLDTTHNLPDGILVRMREKAVRFSVPRKQGILFACGTLLIGMPKLLMSDFGMCPWQTFPSCHFKW